MSALSRRAFGHLVMTGVPAATVLRSIALRASADSLVLGVTTTSFRELPRVTGRDNVDDVLRALQAVRATHVDFSLSHVEPAPPSTGPMMGGSAAYPKRVVLSPEEVAATNVAARSALREWRTRAGVEAFDDARRKATAAGLTIDAVSVSYNDSFSDEEIEATLRQAKALGAPAVRSALTPAMARRVAPLAERHAVLVAIHTQVDGAGDAIGAQGLDAALAISPVIRVALDIGNLTASGCDPAAMLRQYRTRVSQVIVRDRLQRGGSSQPFGEGDTPIPAVLRVLQEAHPAIPAFVEYDYIGLRPAVQEVSASLAYLKELGNAAR